MKHVRKRQVARPLRLALAAAFIAALAVIWAETSVARMLDDYGEHAAVTKAQAIFADVVGELCKTEAFADATAVQTGETGDVTAVFGNAALQNRLQADLAAALCEAFEQSDRASFSVPLGTLFGDPLSSGRGPSVNVCMAMEGSPVVTLADEFSAAGINQTYHTVTDNADVTVLCTALGKTRQTTLSLSVPVSQTVIVGDVPTFYAAF